MTAKGKGIPKKDVMDRMSYLYQSAFHATADGNIKLARSYTGSLREVARKNVLRM